MSRLQKLTDSLKDMLKIAESKENQFEQIVFKNILMATIESMNGKVFEDGFEYIEQNYQKSDLSISDISEKLCVNQTYLRKMFKSEMDMTLSEYITAFRMQEAKRLITGTDEKLTTVAELVGYSDVSYFSNVFKKFYGISPRTMTKE